ncbi:MAG: hypothetical protein ACXAC8_14455 [Candidatus Hodarchaeales archaeon]
MTVLIEKIINVISNLPDPANLTKVVGKIQESNNTLEFDEAKILLLSDFLNTLPAQKSVVIDHIKVRSEFSCPKCGAGINNGYFKILLIFLSESAPTKTIDIKQQIVMSYEVLHNMEKHRIYDTNNSATNENFGELEHQNNKKNPRDQLNQHELHNQIKKYTLEELDILLIEMMTQI